MGTFTPYNGQVSGAPNQSSVWQELSSGGTFRLPNPTVAAGQVLEYVVYVKATQNITFNAASYVFDSLVNNGGYSIYTDNDNLLDPVPAGAIVAFAVSQMGTSRNLLVSRLIVSTPAATP
jgi:hypothetical protein